MLDPTHTGAQIGIGNILFRGGELDRAAEAYQRVVQGCADCADAHRGLGAVYLRQRRFAEARQAYQQALLSEPDHAPSHYNIGAAFGQEGTYQEAAAAAMEQAIASDSKYILAYTALGDVYCLKLGQCEKAAALLEQAVNLQPTAVAPRIGLGRAHLRLGRYEEATASFEAAIAADSTAAAAFNWLGVARTRLGQYELAAQALRRAIHFDMLDPQAYYNLSQTYQKQGKTKESDAALRAFNRIDAYSGAILRWKTILDGNPHDAMALFELGRIYARLGVASEAAASFQRALTINPLPCASLAQSRQCLRPSRPLGRGYRRLPPSAGAGRRVRSRLV